VFKSVGSLINNLPKRSKIPEVILALEVRRIAGECMRGVYPDLKGDLIDSIKISSFKKGTLWVKAPMLLSAELQMCSEGLKREINKKLGREIVSKIRFRVCG
jgi:hypothetical protein